MYKGWLTRLRLLARGALARLRMPGAAYYINGPDTLPPPLTPAEEKLVFQGLEEGRQSCRDILITHNLRLVVYIARKFESSGIPVEDIISIGTIGLIKAVNSFDNTKKARFSTYASKCIDNEVRMSFRKLKKAPATMSMQDPIEAGKDGSTLTVIDVVPDDFIIHEDYEQREESARLHDFVEHLSGRERQVILLRYGLSGQPPLTQQEVADLLGISRSYISRIEKAAVEKLRTGMTSQEFCTKLLEQKHVALVPGDAFGASGEGYCRVSYAYSVEHLTEAMKRIREFLKENGINSGEQ